MYIESEHQMTDNMHIWNAVEATDPAKTKSFTRAGGFKGTATNATWLAMRATEMFGPCGIGWGAKVIDERLLDGAPFQKTPSHCAKIHRVHIKLWYVLDGVRGEIEHFGQTEFCGERADGRLYTDEEAPKKSLTDAMTKALSMLGFAADIHMGLFDDHKYVNEAREKFATNGNGHASSSVSVLAYVKEALDIIAKSESAEKLKEWWLGRRQQDMRAALGIVKGTPEYKKLFEALSERGKTLAPPTTSAGSVPYDDRNPF
jgi:hypothetical protein